MNVIARTDVALWRVTGFEDRRQDVLRWDDEEGEWEATQLEYCKIGDWVIQAPPCPKDILFPLKGEKV